MKLNLMKGKRLLYRISDRVLKRASDALESLEGLMWWPRMYGDTTLDGYLVLPGESLAGFIGYGRGHWVWRWVRLRHGGGKSEWVEMWMCDGDGHKTGNALLLGPDELRDPRLAEAVAEWAMCPYYYDASEGVTVGYVLLMKDAREGMRR